MSHFDGLKNDPQAYHVFQALRILEAQHDDKPRLGESRRPREDAFRLGQEAEMAFPPTTLREYLPATQTSKPTLINRFFGFFGPHGPMPIHFTEYARERKLNNGDGTLVEFLNMLTHRMMSLLYRAWTTGQPAVDLDRGEDTQIERHVAALSGHHGMALRKRDQMPDLAKRHFAGLLSMGPRNPEGLVALLSGFFSAPVIVEQFVGSWLELDPSDRWELGSTVGLGQETSIGARVWSRSSKFRLHIGPLSRDDYVRLLPGSPSLERLTAIVRNYVGDTLDYDINIILKGDDVPPAILGQDIRLGHTTWIGDRDSSEDADDLNLSPHSLTQRAA